MTRSDLALKVSGASMQARAISDNLAYCARTLDGEVYSSVERAKIDSLLLQLVGQAQSLALQIAQIEDLAWRV